MKKKLILIVILLVVCFSVFWVYGKIFPKYKKIGILYDRLTSEPTLVRDLVNSGERLARTENSLNDDVYENEGGYMLRSNIYCSYDISNQIEKISEKTGVNHYKGNLELVSLDDFKNYLDMNSAFCVEVLPLENKSLYGDVNRALSWFTDENNWKIYKKR